MKKWYLVSLMVLSIFVLIACDNTEAFDGDINVYTRDTSSGTRDGFMSGIDFSDAATDDSLLVEGFATQNNAGIMNAMRTDVNGIGYVSMASLNDTIKAVNFEGVEPTLDNVINDSYGLKRPFNYMLRAEGDYESDEIQAIVAAFVAYLNTTDASDVINDIGAIALPAEDTWDDIKDDHPICAADNSALTLRFGGSDSITAVAQALSDDFSPRCGDIIPEHDHTGSSDGYKRTQGEEKDGVNAKEIGFASRPFRGEEVANTTASSRGQLAWDAIVVIVNKDNPIESLSAEQIRKIYAGDITNWAELVE